MSICEACQFFDERCPKIHVGLKTDNRDAFQPADDKTIQYREAYKRITQIALYGDKHDKEEKD